MIMFNYPVDALILNSRWAQGEKPCKRRFLFCAYTFMYAWVHVCFRVSKSFAHVCSSQKSSSFSAILYLIFCLFVCCLCFVLLNQDLSLARASPGHQVDYAKCPANPRVPITSLVCNLVCATKPGFKKKMSWGINSKPSCL